MVHNTLKCPQFPNGDHKMEKGVNLDWSSCTCGSTHSPVMMEYSDGWCANCHNGDCDVNDVGGLPTREAAISAWNARVQLSRGKDILSKLKPCRGKDILSKLKPCCGEVPTLLFEEDNTVRATCPVCSQHWWGSMDQTYWNGSVKPAPVKPEEEEAVLPCSCGMAADVAWSSSGNWYVQCARLNCTINDVCETTKKSAVELWNAGVRENLPEEIEPVNHVYRDTVTTAQETPDISKDEKLLGAIHTILSSVETPEAPSNNFAGEIHDLQAYVEGFEDTNAISVDGLRDRVAALEDKPARSDAESLIRLRLHVQKLVSGVQASNYAHSKDSIVNWVGISVVFIMALISLCI